MSQPAYRRYTLALADKPGVPALDYVSPAAVAVLRELPAAGWQESEDGGTIVFWLRTGVERESVVADGLAGLARLGRLASAPEARDWETAWQAFHQPVAVGDVYVRPPWHPSRPGCLDVVIDAGMAFGMGSHATTRACLQALCALPRGSLLDIGTGTGVLALAALRLGFAPVYAIDSDDVALTAAERNAAANGLAPILMPGDIRDPLLVLPQTNVVVANLALDPLLVLAERYEPNASAAGERPWRPTHLLLAGLLESQVEQTVAAYVLFTLRERVVVDDWALVHLAISS
jgi:ribosomal protein L11 methyltransferase